MAKPSHPPIQRADAVQAALALIDKHGLAAFSIRKLAKEMGISAPTLYYHFANKDEILESLGKSILAGMRRTKAPPDPIDAISAHSLDYYRIFAEHPAAAELIGAEFRRAHTLRWYEYLIGLLEDAGVPGSNIVSVVEALDALLQGMASNVASPDNGMAALRRADLSTHPKLRRALEMDAATDLERLDKAVRSLLRGWISEEAQPADSRVGASNHAGV